jgi:hypothetical protein
MESTASEALQQPETTNLVARSIASVKPQTLRFHSMPRSRNSQALCEATMAHAFYAQYQDAETLPLQNLQSHVSKVLWLLKYL